MASVQRLNYYKKTTCANCNYSWDYPYSNRAKMSELQNLFYFELHLCPHCNSLGYFITEVGEFELQVQNDKQYKEIIKKKNEAFGMVCKKETYKYLLYAYICEKKGDDFMTARTYYMANKVEKFQREKYIESMLYKEHEDAKMIKESKEKEEEYLRKSIYYMQRYVNNHQDDIDASIMLAVIYKLACEGEKAVTVLNSVMKKNVTQRQIQMVKEVVKMKLGSSEFLRRFI